MGEDHLEKHIEVSQPAIVEMQGEVFGRPGDRFRTNIRGWSTGEYVLLDWPDDPAKSVLIRRHAQYLVRFLADGVACGFLASISESEVTRRSHFRVTWPEQVETVRLRRHERMNLTTPCRAIFPDGDEVECELNDISVGGCRLSFDRPVEEGIELRLSFSLEQGLLMAGIRALVRSVCVKGEITLAGCEFAGLDDRRRYDIEFYLAAAQGHSRKQERNAPHILICEHELEHLAVFREQFEQSGLNVATATNLIDAFYLLRLSPPDVLVLPMQIDGVSWLEICHIIRQNRNLSELVMVLWVSNGKIPDDASLSQLVQGWFVRLDQALQTVQEVLPETARET